MKNLYKATLVSAALIASAGALAGWNSVNETTEHSAQATETSTEVSSETQRSKTYDVDSTHAGVVFKIRHRGVSSFYGQFSTIQGTIEFDKLHVARSSMSLVVPIKSIYTGDRTRDGHLKGADFFNMRQYPEATFVSTGIEETSDGVYAVTGDLTLQGKTVEVVAQVTDLESKNVNGMNLMGFEATFFIKRSDFGITKHLDPSDPEGGSLGDIVELMVSLEAVEK